MFQLVLAGTLLAFASCDICCSPMQFEVNEGEITMYVRGGRSHLETGASQVSYDFTNNRMAVDETITTDGKAEKIHLIYDFAKQHVYVITAAGCSTHHSEGALNYHCIPDTAEWRGSFYFGANTHRVWVNNYKLLHDNATYFIDVTRDHCVPVGESIHGKDELGDWYLKTLGYVNAHIGVMSVTVFDIPGSCSPLIPVGKRSSELESLLQTLRKKWTIYGRPMFDLY